MKRNRLTVQLICIAILAYMVSSCGGGKKEHIVQATDKFDMVMEYIETNGDFINSEECPAPANSAEVMELMDKNIHIIDIRLPEDYAAGHISGAVNVAFSELITHFETSINPANFETIFLFSSDGQAAFFASGLLRILGYENVRPVKWGMSGWDKSVAEQYWLKHISSSHSGILTTEPAPQAASEIYPVITSDLDNEYDLIRKRAIELLQQPYKNYIIDIEKLMTEPSAYYIICYCKEDFYNIGHIPGSVNYTPKKSLSRKTQLSTLPVDKPIVLYCYSGNHSSTVAAYLRLIGYEAYSLYYGANSFMHDKMSNMKEYVFTEDEIMNYPLEKQKAASAPEQKEHNKPVSQGGC